MCSRTAEVYIDDEFHMYILAPKVICGTKLAKLPAGHQLSLVSAGWPVYHARMYCVHAIS